MTSPVNRPARALLALLLAVLAGCWGLGSAAYASPTPSGSGSESGSESADPSEPADPQSDDGEVGEEAVDPPLPEGLTPIEGGPSGSQSVPITPGRYLGTFGEPGGDDAADLFVFTRAQAGSELSVGVTVLAYDAIATKTRIALKMGYVNDAGRLIYCGSAITRPEQRTKRLPVVSTVMYLNNQSVQCRTNLEMRILVGNPAENGLPAGTSYQLDVRETPAIANLADMPTVTDAKGRDYTVHDPTVTVEPGAWPSEAAILESEQSTHVDLPLGRVSWFAARVEYSQSITAFATVSDPAGSSGGTIAELRIYSPVGGVATEDSYRLDRFQHTVTVGDEPVSLEDDSYVVNPVTRTQYTLSSSQKPSSPIALMSDPGWYYIAVYADNITGDPDATLPITLSAIVRDAPEPFGLPPLQFAGPVTELPQPTGATPTEWDGELPATSTTPREEPSGGTTASGAEPDDGLDLPLAGGIAAGVLLVAAAGSFGILRLARPRR